MGNAPQSIAPASTSQAQPMQWWRIGRASIGFLLDTFAASRAGGDVVDPLILAVILEANIAPVTNDPQLAPKYAALDDPPPEDLRRAVSINAVAASLRLPYETVRRRVGRLAKLGACVITSRVSRTRPYHTATSRAACFPGCCRNFLTAACARIRA